MRVSVQEADFDVGAETEALAAGRPEGTENTAEFPDPDAVAVVLFTSGTTSAPKAVELTHNNLTSYITGTVLPITGSVG